jgi:hypothetical protein
LYVYISDPDQFLNLQQFLRQAGCTAERRRSHELLVYLPGAPSEAQARREVNVYLASWQARNRGVEAYIVESGDTETPGK